MFSLINQSFFPRTSLHGPSVHHAPLLSHILLPVNPSTYNGSYFPALILPTISVGFATTHYPPWPHFLSLLQLIFFLLLFLFLQGFFFVTGAKDLFFFFPAHVRSLYSFLSFATFHITANKVFLFIFPSHNPVFSPTTFKSFPRSPSPFSLSCSIL